MQIMKYSLSMILVVAALAIAEIEFGFSSHADSAEIRSGVRWSYDGKTGPEHWGHLDPSFSSAVSGRRQSPINISDPAPVGRASIQFAYQEGQFAVMNTGYAIQVKYGKGSDLAVKNRIYRLREIQFHSPSEHTVHGRRFPMEMHLVHERDDGSKAIVAVLITSGRRHETLQKIIDHIPAHKGAHEVKNSTIDANRLLPEHHHHYYEYNGSLTVPPFTENIRWFVLADPVEASKAQISKFRALYDHNARPIQARHERFIFEGQ